MSPGEAQHVPFGDQSISQIAAQVADPAHHSGGVAIAAVTLAGASGAAELVLTLAARRKANAARRDEIEQTIAGVRELRGRFLDAADRDIEAFQRLMDLQRQQKESGQRDQERLNQAYLDAAASPLDLAEDGLELMRIARRYLELGTRFTVSDMGAAAALAHGAIDASLMTSETNLALAGESGAPGRERAERIRQEARPLDDEIQRAVQGRIRGE